MVEGRSGGVPKGKVKVASGQHGGHFLGGRGRTGRSQRVQDRRVFQERFFGRHLFSFGWDRGDVRLLVQSVTEFLVFPALAMSFLAGFFALESPVKRDGFGTTLRHLVSRSEDPRRPRPPLSHAHPAKPCGWTSSSTNGKPAR